MIYFAQIDIPNGPVKIGMAKNPEKRVRQLNKNMPWKLKLVKVLNGDYEEEKKIHMRLIRYKIKESNGREWFNSDSLKFIEFLRRISEKNLSADRQMSKEEMKEYLSILLDCVCEKGINKNENNFQF